MSLMGMGPQHSLFSSIPIICSSIILGSKGLFHIRLWLKLPLLKKPLSIMERARLPFGRKLLSPSIL